MLLQKRLDDFPAWGLRREVSRMRILVTGASGLLGLNLALEAGASREGGLTGSIAEHTVIGVVNRHPLFTHAFEVIQADLLAPGVLESLVEKTQPDWIFNCAALAILDECEANPELANKLNVDLPRKLAKIVARGGARLVHISTDSVFDGQRGEYTEDDAPNPLNVYARTKLAGEQAVAEENPQAIVARVNLFGWSLFGKRSLAEWFFNNLSLGKPMLGFTDIYFCPMLVNDLARVLIHMAQAGLSGLYHATSPKCTSKYDFGIALARIFSLDERLISPASISASDLKVVRSPYLTLRSDRLQQALVEPLPDWQTGLTHFYELYRQGYSGQLREMAA
jgi:dTDP-4-dehydrorhamnose reductase